MQDSGVTEQLQDLGTEQPFDMEVDEPPSYDVFEDCFPETEHELDEDALQDEGLEPSKRREGATRPIVIFPTEETYTGTSWEAILLKWHYHLGHIHP